ncbi:carbohydrate ABC transporter permease [Phytoactinopolyspora halotolerans]|uniref:Sugar ABC transporter permease n=1 Tax=Phytoactinopolyspora halotolerans TaxID=1981512 RepID=A0A6L9S812_9ACTN|nr:sugar ABC transporter permease [Phytoactinopolyspora halotolerans]NEE01259.1 sugar ABC transporter permease [Phytoactinopolyspora halotolerans]
MSERPPGLHDAPAEQDDSPQARAEERTPGQPAGERPGAGAEPAPRRGRKRGGRRRPLGLRAREARLGLGLVSPTLVIVLLVVVLPFLWTILMSFQRLRLIDLQNVFDVTLTLRNFRVVLGSPQLWDMVRTTLIYSIAGTALSVGMGLLTALALRRTFAGRGLIRIAVLFPYVIPVVSAALVWRTLLNPQFGPVNVFGVDVLGWDEPIGFLSERSHRFEVLGIGFDLPVALLSVIAFEAWKTFPLAFLFILARLQGMPKDLEEAARVDGATPLQRFRYVIMPQLAGVIALLVLLRFIWTFQNFNDVYLLTGGAAGTEVVAVQVYNYLINRNDVGSAAALGLLMSIVLVTAFAFYYRYGVLKQERDA